MDLEQSATKEQCTLLHGHDVTLELRIDELHTPRALLRKVLFDDATLSRVFCFRHICKRSIATFKETKCIAAEHV